MHPAGCFGSSLAYDAKSATCVGCSKRAECAALVEARRPILLRVLDKFSDGKGRTMAWPWLTASERKKRRAAEQEAAKAYTKELTLGDSAVGLTAMIDDRAHPAFDALIAQQLDPRTAPLDQVALATPQMGAVIAALKTAPQTIKGLTAAIASRCDVSASTARRDAYAATSLLTACDRATRVGPMIELA